MNKNLLIKIFSLLSLLTLIMFFSCEEDEVDQSVALYSYGPMPIPRGAELRFIGSNLDKVTSIVLPGNMEITEFGTKSSTLLTITVPQDAIEGLVTIKYEGGEIVTKTPIGYLEPIIIDSFSPSEIRPDSVLTIKGDYLNLINEVIFTDGISASGESIISKSRSELKVKVPSEAKSGKIALSDGEDDPIIVYSEESLMVVLPEISSISPNPVKAGTMLTINGANLDLVKHILFGGNKLVSEFDSQTATKLTVEVPEDAQDGKVVLLPASAVEVESESALTMIVPEVSVTPTTVKNGGTITVTGTNLDLVSSVVFGGGFEGVVQDGGTDSEIIVEVPEKAVSGVVNFNTMANKTVAGPTINIVDPEITSFNPSTAKANQQIVISGTNLDLVSDVKFGDVSGSIDSQNETELTVTVPVGAASGKITLIAQNGVEVQSLADVVIEANLPDIDPFADPLGKRGEKLIINGSNLSLIKELIFPGDVPATSYGLKSDTQIEVYVPVGTVVGYGQIKMITYEGEEGVMPELFFYGVEPITNSTLIINDFDEEGHNLGWDNWGGNVELGNDPSEGISSGSGQYLHGTNAALSGWAWIWGCNHDQLPKPSVTKADYVVKVDVKVTKPLPSDAAFQIEFAGSRIDVGPFGVEKDGNYIAPGWITLTYDLSEYGSLPDVIPASGEWGLNQSAGTTDLTGLYMDNFRFEPK